MIRVLFVDDEPNVLSGLRRMLHGNRREWDMAFSSSGDDALAKMREKPFDVVVSDMRMPGMDGAALLRRIQDEWPNTIRLVLSGQSDDELTLRAVGPAHQYLNKPCDPVALENTIRQACASNLGDRSQRVRKLVARIETPPSPPDAYQELMAEMNSPHASIDSIGRIISRDVGMSAKVLQLINSSFFGLPVHVADVEHATALLGLNIVRPLVLSASVFRKYEQSSLGLFELSSLVDHSLCVAMLARRIAVAENQPADTVDASLLAGMMHDVGQIILAEHCTEEYDDVIQTTRDSDRTLTEVEEDTFGFTHADVGGHLLSLWGLPKKIVDAVAFHHDPGASADTAFTPLTPVHAAEVAVAGENEGLPEREEYSNDYLARIDMLHRANAWEAEWVHPTSVTSDA